LKVKKFDYCNRVMKFISLLSSNITWILVFNNNIRIKYPVTVRAWTCHLYKKLTLQFRFQPIDLLALFQEKNSLSEMSALTFFYQRKLPYRIGSNERFIFTFDFPKEAETKFREKYNSYRHELKIDQVL